MSAGMGVESGADRDTIRAVMARTPDGSPDLREPPEEDRTGALVERIQKDFDANRSFEKLHRRYRKRLNNFFVHKGFSPAESEDLTQETFVRVFRNIERLADRSKFKGWIFEIAANLYRNELRTWDAEKRRGQDVSLDDFAGSREAWRLESSPVLRSGEEDPLAALIERQQREALDAALAELPPQMRRCVLLRVRSAFKYRQIAGVLGISVETVKAYLHQAQDRLKVELSDALGDRE